MIKLTKALSLIALAFVVAAPSAAQADTFITFVSGNGHRSRHESRENTRPRHGHEARYTERHDRQWKGGYHHGRDRHWQRHAHWRSHPPIVYVAPQPTWRTVNMGWYPSPASQVQYRHTYVTYR